MDDFDDNKPNLVKYVKTLLNGETPFQKEKKTLLSEKDREDIISNATDKRNIQEYTDVTEKLNSDRVWNNIKRSQNKLSNGSSKNWLYAAASVAILISLLFLMDKDDAKQLQGTETILTNNSIQIGTDRAILTLDGGVNVELEKGTSYQTPNANSNGERIVYTTGKNRKSELGYNSLTIPRGGQFNVQLSDGTLVWLNSDSKLKYPIEFTEGETREVELLYGEAYFDVSPSTEHNGARFKVLHKSQEIEVFGTEFNVKAYADEKVVYTTLVEGKVMVTATYAHQKLIPSEQATLDLDTNQMEVKTVDTYDETSWRKGIFSFRGKPLEDIMVVLSRWYDFEPKFENEALKNELFSGALKKESSIITILNKLKKAKFINAYDIKDKKVILK